MIGLAWAVGIGLVLYIVAWIVVWWYYEKREN